ncbi:30S ribosomal protein S9 [Patescibacteria group bacterium]
MPKNINKYYYSRGRRKTAIARVRLYTTKQSFESLVNELPLEEYFSTEVQQKAILAPIKTVGLKECTLSLKVEGGGKNAQADAVQLGISRALIIMDEKLRPTLKKAGFLTRDSREKERKKYGLKRARKAPQWSKR